MGKPANREPEKRPTFTGIATPQVQTRTEESMEARAKLAVQARQHAADVGVATATHAHAMQVPRTHPV